MAPCMVYPVVPKLLAHRCAHRVPQVAVSRETGHIRSSTYMECKRVYQDMAVSELVLEPLTSVAVRAGFHLSAARSPSVADKSPCSHSAHPCALY